jgi:NAD(P)-dependent dehydrogenase (short-subunit alcohol dehydrogenase family)
MRTDFGLVPAVTVTSSGGFAGSAAAVAAAHSFTLAARVGRGVTDSTTLDGRVYVVTGAASGLGLATAEALGERGATVVVCDLGSEPHGESAARDPVAAAADAVRAAGGEAVESFGDVTDPAYVSSMVERVAEECGRIDGAVNYAGFLRDDMSFSMPLENWEAVLSVHLGGHFNLVKALGAHWRDRHKAGELDGQRSFVAVSSASARGSASQINYSAAKAGVLGLARTAARELDQYDVRVNAMMPAAVTRMIDANVPEDVVERLPRDALGPEKVAPLPVVLLSDRAVDVTGWTFAIAGDSVFTVSDPELRTEVTMDGGWTADALADALDGELLGDEPRSKLEPGGLLSRVLE